MEHVPPREREIIHQYYHEIGQKGGRHRGTTGSNEGGYDPSVRRGFLSTLSDQEQQVIHKWLHSIQTYKNVGEKQAEEELEREFSGRQSTHTHSIAN